MKKFLYSLSIVILLAILLAGAYYLFLYESKEAKLKENFTKASQLLACEVVKDPSIAVETAKSKDVIKSLFEKNDLPIDNDEVMMDLFDKYENDQDVKTAIQKYLDEECKIN